MTWVYYILMLLIMLCGMFISILGLPGIWLMVLSIASFAWLTRAHGYVSGGWLIALTIIAALAETVEFAAGSAGAGKAGGSKRAMIGAVIGALLGGIFLTFIPIPIISTIVGVCLGAFIGAGVVELAIFNDVNRSLRVGVGAAQGRFLGLVSKLIFCCVILIISVVIAFPVGGATSIAPRALPTSIPTTQQNNNFQN